MDRQQNARFRPVALLAVFLSILFVTVNASSDPNFSQIDDPFDGDYRLFRVDDLVVQGGWFANNQYGLERIFNASIIGIAILAFFAGLLMQLLAT